MHHRCTGTKAAIVEVRLCQLFMTGRLAGNVIIAEDEVVRDCLEKAALIRAGRQKGTGLLPMPENLEEAVEKGVFGAPFYIP